MAFASSTNAEGDAAQYRLQSLNLGTNSGLRTVTAKKFVRAYDPTMPYQSQLGRVRDNLRS